MKNKKQRKTYSTDKAKAPLPEVVLHISEKNISFFLGVLQAGVQMQVSAKTSLGNFLCNCPGFSPQYVKEEVQTIFINGKAVDDLETPLAGRHLVVAVSAAMPGLAGAIFRRNGLHASLRTSPGLEAKKEKPAEKRETIDITLKLFNTILRDTGREMLRSGVIIPTTRFVDFFNNRRERLQLIEKAILDTQELSASALPSRIVDKGSLNLRLTAKTAP